MEQTQIIENEFIQFVDQNAFPCVGAKTALNKDNISVFRYGDINSTARDTDLLTNIYSFTESFNIDTDMYSSFVAVFDDEAVMLGEVTNTRRIVVSNWCWLTEAPVS